LAQLIQDYEDYMNKFEVLHPDIPVIRIDGDKMDFVKHQKNLDKIIERVEQQMCNHKTESKQ
jgi:deoxyguanosine kinase